MKYLDYNGLNRFWQRVKGYVNDYVKASMVAIETAMNKKANTTALSDGSVTKVGKTTVGSGTRPIYLSAGVPTASSSNVGNSRNPVFLKNGVLTITDYDMSLPVQLLFRGQIIHNASTCGWNKHYLRCMFAGLGKADFKLTRSAKGTVEITLPAKLSSYFTDEASVEIYVSGMSMPRMYSRLISSDTLTIKEYDANGALADGGFNIAVYLISADYPEAVI
jgi:hypothetical protein